MPLVERKRIRHILVVSGIFHGSVDNTQAIPVINHQFANDTRDGSIYTQNDQLDIIGVELCSAQPELIQLNVTEILNFDYGMGRFQGLQPGGNIKLEGTVNFCTLQNDFQVTKHFGGLCFGNENCS